MKQCGVPRSVLISEHRRNLARLKFSMVSLFIEPCYGVVGFTMNDVTKDCEVLSNSKCPQRAKAMKSKDGHPTSSGKPMCTTSHSAQLKARIEEALSRNVRTVPFRLKGKLVDVWPATLVHMQGESCGYDLRRQGRRCRRFHTDSEQFQVQDLDDGATHDESIEGGRDHQELVRDPCDD